MTTLADIKPSDINTEKPFPSGVARNLVICLTEQGDRWKPFSWAQYCDWCGHEPTTAERDELNYMVKNERLVWDNNLCVWGINDTFIVNVLQYLKRG